MNTNYKIIARSLAAIGLAGMSLSTMANQPTLSGDFMRTWKQANEKTRIFDDSYTPHLKTHDAIIKLQNAADCEDSSSKGCTALREKARDQFQATGNAVARAIPSVKAAWTDMKAVAGREVRQKVARQSFQQLSRELAGITAQDRVKVSLQRKGGVGKLLQHIGQLNKAFTVGGASERSPALTASQVYLTMHFAIEGLDDLKSTIDGANMTIENQKMLATLSGGRGAEIESLKRGAGLDNPYGTGYESVSYDQDNSSNVQWEKF